MVLGFTRMREALICQGFRLFCLGQLSIWRLKFYRLGRSSG